MKRRITLALGLGLSLCGALVPAASRAQSAETFPSKPLKILVGFSPGSSTDVATRVVAQKLSQLIGQPVIVDNRPGASSNIAAKATLASPADGYTLFVVTIANTINATLQPEVSVDLGREFVPVGMLGSVPILLVANPSSGLDSLAALTREAKAKPGQITYASSGPGTAPHLSGELFDSMAGVRMLHVPYRGSTPAVTDLLAGQVQIMFAPASTVLPYIRSGKLKALASAGATRTSLMPELPTLAESGLKGFETSVWFGLVAPAGTPQPAIDALAAAVQKAVASPEVEQQFKSQGIDVVASTPASFAQYMRSETTKWAKVIKSAGIKAE